MPMVPSEPMDECLGCQLAPCLIAEQGTIQMNHHLSADKTETK